VVGEILLYFYRSHIPMKKDFLMGQIRKIQKKTRRKECKECRKEKEEIVAYMAVPILMCSPSVEKTPSCDGPSLRRMHSCGNLDYNI